MDSNKKRVTNQLEANMTESDDTLLKNLLSEIEQLGIVELRKYFKDLYGFETRQIKCLASLPIAQNFAGIPKIPFFLRKNNFY